MKRVRKALSVVVSSVQVWRCAWQKWEGIADVGFGFQVKCKSKVKDHFLNQRRWTCWFSWQKKNKNKKIASTLTYANLVWILFSFSLWKACWLCCLPDIATEAFVYLFIYVCLFVFLLSLSLLLLISFHCVCQTFCKCVMPCLVLFVFVNKCYIN